MEPSGMCLCVGVGETPAKVFGWSRLSLISHLFSHLGAEAELKPKSDSLPSVFKLTLFYFWAYRKLYIFREIVRMEKKKAEIAEKI